jgi:hypothetical protein
MSWLSECWGGVAGYFSRRPLEETQPLIRGQERRKHPVVAFAENEAAAQPHAALAYAFYAFFLSHDESHVAFSRGIVFYYELFDSFRQAGQIAIANSIADQFRHGLLMLKDATAVTALLLSAFNGESTPKLPPQLFTAVFGLSTLSEIIGLFSNAQARISHAFKALMLAVCLVGILQGLVLGEDTEEWGASVIAAQGLLWLNAMIGDPFSKPRAAVPVSSISLDLNNNDDDPEIAAELEQGATGWCPWLRSKFGC